MKVSCPNCGAAQEVQLDDGTVASKAKCDACGTSFLVRVKSKVKDGGEPVGPQKAYLWFVRKTDGTLLSFPGDKQLHEGIQKGFVLLEDEISADGVNWTMIASLPILARFVERWDGKDKEGGLEAVRLEEQAAPATELGTLRLAVPLASPEASRGIAIPGGQGAGKQVGSRVSMEEMSAVAEPASVPKVPTSSLEELTREFEESTSTLEKSNWDGEAGAFDAADRGMAGVPGGAEHVVREELDRPASGREQRAREGAAQLASMERVSDDLGSRVTPPGEMDWGSEWKPKKTYDDETAGMAMLLRRKRRLAAIGVLGGLAMLVAAGLIFQMTKGGKLLGRGEVSATAVDQPGRKTEDEAATKGEEAIIPEPQKIGRVQEERPAKVETEELARAEEVHRLKGKEEGAVKAETEELRWAEVMARLKAEEEARLKAEAEAKAAQEARLKAEAEARAAEEARLKAEAEAKAKAQEVAQLKAEAEAQAKEKGETKSGVEAKVEGERKAEWANPSERKKSSKTEPDGALAARDSKRKGKRDDTRYSGSSFGDEPSGFDGLMKKGDRLRKDGNWYKALEYYRKALELKPTYSEVHYKIGECYRSIGNCAEAVKSFKRAIELSGFKNAYIYIAKCYISMGQKGEARRYLKAGLEKYDDGIMKMMLQQLEN